jgi:hypothetical protein
MEKGKSFENMLKAALVIHKQQQLSIKQNLKTQDLKINLFVMISSREMNFLRCCRHLRDFSKTFSSLRLLSSK